MYAKKLLINLAVLSTFSIVSLPANAVPATAWRTRKTSALNREECVLQAANSMEKAGLDEIRYSGTDKMAVHGKNEQISSTIVCENAGSLAAIFCSSYNYNEILNMCDYLAGSMSDR